MAAVVGKWLLIGRCCCDYCCSCCCSCCCYCWRWQSLLLLRLLVIVAGNTAAGNCCCRWSLLLLLLFNIICLLSACSTLSWLARSYCRHVKLLATMYLLFEGVLTPVRVPADCVTFMGSQLRFWRRYWRTNICTFLRRYSLSYPSWLGNYMRERRKVAKLRARRTKSTSCDFRSK